MRARLAPLLLAAVIVGCGGSEPAGPEPAADRAAIQKRVTTYIGAMLAGDGKLACAQLTPGYRRDAERRARESGMAGCADAIAFYGETVSGSVPRRLVEQVKDPAMVQVKLSGDAAEAALRVPSGELSVKRTTLRRVGADWLIDALGVTRPRG